MYSLIVVFLLSLCFYTAVSACPSGSVYVSTQGNDTTGDGTIDKPFQKLLAAYNKISNNLIGTICILPGKYNDTSKTIWTGNCSVSLVPVDPSNPPIFESIIIEFSNITLSVENLVFGSNCVFVLDHGANLTITNITSPSTYVDIFIISGNTVILNHLKLGSLEVNYLPGVGLSDVQVFDANIGRFRVTSRSVSLYACSFSGPVYLSAGITMTQQCRFSSINSNQNILNIVSFDWINARHSLQNNTFINNTLTDNYYNSVIGLLFSLEPTTHVNFYGNRFSCNMLALPNKTSTVARGLPSDVIDNNWVISSNTMDPSCPYECLPGYEPALNGIAGCSMCLPGWISSGHTAPCTPCPAGTYGRYYSNNCTACDPGTYSGQNSSVCLICQDGTPTQNNTGCIPCPTDYYSYLGICKKCTDKDYAHRGCADCGFFMSVESNCKQLSVNGMIVIGAMAGPVFVIIVAIIVFRCVRKREYSQLN